MLNPEKEFRHHLHDTILLALPSPDVRRTGIAHQRAAAKGEVARPADL